MPSKYSNDTKKQSLRCLSTNLAISSVGAVSNGSQIVAHKRPGKINLRENSQIIKKPNLFAIVVRFLPVCFFFFFFFFFFCRFKVN